MAITKQTCAALRMELTSALALIAKNHGVTISIGTMKFDDMQMNCKLIATAMNENGANQSPAAVDFLRYAKAGQITNFQGAFLNGDDLGKQFVTRGQTYTIAGFLPRAQKNEIIVARDGKNFRMNLAEVLIAMGRKNSEFVPL